LFFHSTIVFKTGSLSFRKLSTRLGGPEALLFFQKPPRDNFDFCYINSRKNYLINQVNRLFQGKSATMFTNKDIFIIHDINNHCRPLEHEKNQKSHVQNQVLEYLKNTYPKQKFISLFFDVLNKNQLVDENLFIVGFPNIHIADLCSFINNKFGKQNTTDPRFLKLCKYLQTSQLRFPRVSIKNPVAIKYLC
jgi:hypothetical protein